MTTKNQPARKIMLSSKVSAPKMCRAARAAFDCIICC
jgi:hypothetical protein